MNVVGSSTGIISDDVLQAFQIYLKGWMWIHGTRPMRLDRQGSTDETWSQVEELKAQLNELEPMTFSLVESALARKSISTSDEIRRKAKQLSKIEDQILKLVG
ncbi:MAG: hypothetical protein EOO88_28975 [Pedobacter sp.]|nr:MAG: hypothetical protein EOO88_28975 [Pedobacter sp.]